MNNEGVECGRWGVGRTVDYYESLDVKHQLLSLFLFLPDICTDTEIVTTPNSMQNIHNGRENRYQEPVEKFLNVYVY